MEKIPVKLPVMINGLPGNVAKTMALGAQGDERFIVIPYSLTGADILDDIIKINTMDFSLIKPDSRDEKIKHILSLYPFFIAIDYTHPSAVNSNARFYTQNNIPFVMGTTGGNRDKLEETVNQGSIPAVIAPNMAKQIVGFQAMVAYGAKTFPCLFKNYSLTIRESHQKDKADTSGTARAMVGYFNDLGVDFKVEDIKQIRTPEIQEKEWQIPKEHLSGHGWHTYTLTSDDGSSLFEFTHNINGRDIYISGTFDAVMFLKEKAMAIKNKQRLFTMIDVLHKG